MSLPESQTHVKHDRSSLKPTLRHSKIMVLSKRELDFGKINVFDSNMVLETFWVFLGLILGDLGAVWGYHGGSPGAPELLKSLGPFDPRSFLSLLMFLLFSFVLFSTSFFYFLPEPLGVDFELPN